MNQEKNIKGMEKNHVTSNRNAEQITMIWKEIRKMLDISDDKSEEEKPKED